MLLKAADGRGLTFYTNYASRKARELASGSRAALLFFWPELERQVRVEGAVEKVDAATADAYWVTRPRLSRIGAWASPQSELLRNRAELEQRFADAEAALSGRGRAASAALGRLSTGPRGVRILAGTGVPAA